jgi:arginine/ornithine succinyltransferase subunit-like protein
MFVIRHAADDDRATLVKLIAMLRRATAPADPEEIGRRIADSRDSLAGRLVEPDRRQFMFVIDDTDAGAAVGMGCIDARASSADRPLALLKVERTQHYSEDLQTGHVHMALTLEMQSEPASRLCDLVLAPPYRGHREHLGALLAITSLHFIGLHRAWFADTLLAPLPAPVVNDGRDTLWEYLGRQFCEYAAGGGRTVPPALQRVHSDALPAARGVRVIAPAGARNVIGRESAAARTARRVLERSGFAMKGRVDPLDGGPVLEATTDELPLVQASRRATLGDPTGSHPSDGIVSLIAGGQFRAVRTPFAVKRDCISIPGEAAGLLRAQVGDAVGVTTLSESDH